MPSRQQSLTGEHLLASRPGEAARALPRWQFGMFRNGEAGATITYPIPGYPWRHNPEEHMKATLDERRAASIFEELALMPSNAPKECLPHDQVWADASEKANSITRDRATNTLCLSLIITANRDRFITCNYFMRENSPALINSLFFQVMSELLAPYRDLYRDGKTRG